MSAQLRRALDMKVSLVEGSYYHDYQPGYTCMAGQLWGKPEKFLTSFGKRRARRLMSETIPRGVEHISDIAAEFYPEEDKLMLYSGTLLHYKYLVLAMGVRYNYTNVKGRKRD